VEWGVATFALTPCESLYNPIGMVHGGVTATLLDSAMGCAVHSELPAGVGYTTLELKANYLRPIVADIGPVRCRARVVHRGGTVATAEGRAWREADGELLGFTIRDVAPGSVTFAMTPEEKHYNPIGMVHGGVTATLLDSAMGCALQSVLPAGVGYSTLDISVRYLRPVTARTGTVVATGALVHKGRRTATAEARLVDETVGQVLATATSTLLVLS